MWDAFVKAAPVILPLIGGAILLAAVTPTGRLPPPPPDERLEAMDGDSEWVEVRRKKLRVFKRGPEERKERAVVFLMHGAGGQVQQWIEQVVPLCTQYKVVAVDMVGHGKSQPTDTPDHYSMPSFVADLLEVFHAHKGDRNIIIAHSYGCSMATKLFPNIESHVHGIVFIGPSCRSNSQPKPAQWLHYTPAFVLDWMRRWDRRGGAKSASIRRMLYEGVSEDLKLRQLTWNAHTPSKVVRWLTLQMEGATPDEYSQISVPSCIIVGAHDHLTPPAVAQRVATALTACDINNENEVTGEEEKESAEREGAGLAEGGGKGRKKWVELHVIERAGHQVMVEQKEEVNEIVRKFLDERVAW